MSVITEKYVPVPLAFYDEAGQALKSKKFGGYDPVANTMTPFKVAPYSQKDNQPMMADMLDSIAAAVNAELVDFEQWPVQLFASHQLMEDFMQELESYEDTYRINDKWWHALASLRDYEEEAGSVRGEEMADTLRQRVTDMLDEGVELKWSEEE
jgi:hypothetical protein